MPESQQPTNTLAILALVFAVLCSLVGLILGIIGLNKYRLEKEDPLEILDIDNSAVRESQIARGPMRSRNDALFTREPKKDSPR